MTEDRFKNWQPPQITHNVPTKWQWMVAHPEGFQIGPRTDIGAFTYINAQGGVEVAEEAQIGSHCSIYSVSTIDGTKGKVLIGARAKIGTHSTIMPGVTVGADAVVGAYSFVKDDIPAGALAFGIPAKVRQADYNRTAQ